MDQSAVSETYAARLRFAERASAHARELTIHTPRLPGRIAFVEDKQVDLATVAELLSAPATCNQWANRGPLYMTLAEAFHDHMGLSPGVAVTPCANGGLALEAMARLLEMRNGRPLRWVGSAFSFGNLGRGWFADMALVDCGADGMLDLDAVAALGPDRYDGIVVTNIFGIWRDFARYAEFAEASGKLMLIDNAAGIGRDVPDWPWQSFSLHHTKPYGAGEGGFAITPAEEAEALYSLMNYGDLEPDTEPYWINNAKLSDIACAFHLDRLSREADWAPRYAEQAARVDAIATGCGLAPLVEAPSPRPAMSLPFLGPRAIPVERVRVGGALQCAKYYKPLARRPRTEALFERIVNIPCHPDLALLDDDELTAVIDGLIAPGPDDA
ncbi:hypothetical protein LNKW23_48300 [Paralimibaculum aggregatum]|uniref:dTDP-4-amino-4,6-dideoxygalactose transaminase n=1 Tax=Paralimibaculum aggregatum TaxID=3036245 RepID=A0ABQ6LU48_9RHOB|nr:DegT/DnrJ/EryC1/StrS family aminotransferase [Limibaculum sp. NKW23]GMG85607.1 hypothetical protein LNKW23_48300 [Limibaculum sp. NKW23]